MYLVRMQLPVCHMYLSVKFLILITHNTGMTTSSNRRLRSAANVCVYHKGVIEQMLKTALIIVYVNKAQFKCRSFHVPNLTHSIKYMKSSTFESIKFDMSNLGLKWV